MMRQTRREFLRRAIAAGPAAALSATSAGAASPAPRPRRPNILMIISDQLNAFTMGVAGCEVRTPNIDRLANEGVWFRGATCAYPLCVPSRIAMAAGVYPHERRYFGNRGGGRSEAVRAEFARRNEGYPLLWQRFSAAGYRCGYAGKWHVPADEKAPSRCGFEYFGNGGIRKRTEEVAERIGQHDGDQPFFYTVSYDKPHEICGWARAHTAGKDKLKPPEPGRCPDLPANFAEGPNVPEVLRKQKELSAKLAHPTAKWTRDDWRQYIWAYRQYTEGLDRLIGLLLAAVDRSPQKDRTIVVFVSDHGDGAAAHEWNQKTALWEECIRVPWIIRAPGGRRGVVDDHPVSSGLDMIPTLLDLAGLSAPAKLRGQSVRPIIEGKPARLREYAVTETAIARAGGRTVRTARYKYIVYSDGGRREQFFDLVEDPGEMRNLIAEASAAGELARHRRLLADWCKRTGDDFEVPA